MKFIPSSSFIKTLFSGLLLSIAFFVDYLGIVVFIALVPILLTLSRDTKFFTILFHSSITVFIFIGSCLVFWVLTNFQAASLTIYGAILVGFLCLVFYLLFFLVWLVSSHYLLFRTPHHFAIFAIPALWSTLEFIRIALYPCLLFSGPWYQLGGALATWPYLIQAVSWIGLPGLSFLIVMVNILVYIALYNRSFLYFSNACIIIFLVLCIGILKIHIKKANNHAPKTINVLVLQTTINGSEIDSDQSIEELIFGSIEICKRHNEIDLIIWPEGSLGKSPKINPWIQDTVQKFVDDNNTPLLAGSPDIMFIDGVMSVRHSAFLFKPHISSPEIYHKEYLVPFGEYQPFNFNWANSDDRQFNFGAIISTPAPCLKLNDIELGISVCYESLFPSHALRLAQAKASFLIQVLDESWFNAFGKHQLMRHAIFRAVETNRWLARSGNMGISCFVSPNGNIVNKLPINLNAATNLIIPINTDLTFYTRYPNIFTICCSLYLLFVFVFCLVRNKIGW